MSEAADPKELDYRRPHREVDERGHHVPARVQTVGMWLFVMALGIAFASGMLIYAIIRYQMSDTQPFGSFREQMSDWKLFVSTVIVLLASFAIHMALKGVQRERMGKFHSWLWATNVLAVLFVVVQTPAMIGLLTLDPQVPAAPVTASPFAGTDPQAGVAGPADLLPAARSTRLYGILFFFVLIHALHVLGGIIYLAIVTWKARKGWYDHEHYVGVRHAALYWHFLDVVWIFMFSTFIILG